MAWAPDYCDLAAFKSYVRIPSGDTEDDTELAEAITSASRAVDRWANRQFGVVASVETRYYPIRWDREQGAYVIEIDDLMTSTGLVVTLGTTVLAASDYVLHPRNAPQKGRPWTYLVLEGSTSSTEAEVVGLWGWSAVPAPVVNATKLQAARIFKRRTSPFGVAGSPEQGSELRLLEKLDVDVAVLIGSGFKRWWAAA